jgi:lauroyl/myristoyl acyltransferase
MSKIYFKKMKYWFGDSFGDLLLAFSILAFRVLPPRVMVFIARILGTMAFCLIKRYRNRVLSNLFGL